MNNIKQYYKELGKLVYALAMADGNIQYEEREKLHEFVLKELAAHERSSDSSGMNQAFYVDFEFEASESSHQDLSEAIRSYNHFIQTHAEPSDKMLFQRSVLLLENVATAYTKKKEKDIIHLIKSKIDGLPK